MKLLQWMRDHETICSVLIWPLLTAIITSVFRKPSPEFSEKWPRLAALRRLPSDAGLNLPKTMENLFILLLGKTKPPGPMAIFLFLATLGALGCAFTAQNAYRRQQEACVEDAKTLQESEECRARVRHEWGVDLEPTITVSDAGADHAAE